MSPALNRIHRWVGLPLLVLTLGMAGLWAWKQELGRQLRTASEEQQLDRCLQLERRLQILDWVPSPVSGDAGRCRREAAQRLWDGFRREEALRLQQELVSSNPASGDIRRLQLWKAELQASALRAYADGNLDRAVALLRMTDTAGGDPGVAAMVNQLQQNWSANSTRFAQAEDLAGRNQWWEALSALNGLSHPYWRIRSLPLRKTVEAGLARIEKQRVDTHGPVPYAISGKRLDELVRKRVAAGVPEWQAFGETCRAMGGRVVDGGPEATCQP